MYARPFIDSLDFARNGQQISGEIPVAELTRLVDVLSSPEGLLRYTVQGGVDKLGIAWLAVDVSGMSQLYCQRCLEKMQYEVCLTTHLLLRDQASLDALDDEEEEFDSILAETHLDVLNLLEEEILLSLPIAPKHKFESCQVASSVATDSVHPFAVLATLKNH